MKLVTIQVMLIFTIVLKTQVIHCFSSTTCAIGMDTSKAKPKERILADITDDTRSMVTYKESQQQGNRITNQQWF